MEVIAERVPPSPRTSARMPRVRSRACLTKSISSPRTRVSRESDSTSTASACVGAGCRALEGLRDDFTARSRAVVRSLAHPSVPPTVRSSTRIVGRPTPTGTRLAVLAAGADAAVESEVVADASRRAAARPGRCRSGWRP